MRVTRLETVRRSLLLYVHLNLPILVFQTRVDQTLHVDPLVLPQCAPATRAIKDLHRTADLNVLSMMSVPRPRLVSSKNAANPATELVV